MDMFRHGGAAVILAMVAGGFVRADSRSAVGQQRFQISGIVHEAKPTENTMISAARVAVMGGEIGGQAVPTDNEGRFTLPPVSAAGFVLEITKPGYETARVRIAEFPRDANLDVTMMHEYREVVVNRSGANDCVDLPTPPPGVPGVREYARVPVHQDGAILVKSARLPFSSNEGYVYRLTPAGWVKNEFDYILLGTPVPVQGGFIYSITFGGGTDLCGAWSLDATRPS